MSDFERVNAIADAATAADGAAPLDEATLITMRRHPERVRTLLADGGAALLIGSELSLVVDPEARGRGVGGGLLEEVLAADVPTPLLAWSHGDHPAAARLADRHGFERARDLWVMRRPSALALGAVVAPDDVTIRSYRPTDADEVLRVNAAAFAHHPEQGGMDAANLAERMAEPWFDPAGLLLAISDGRVVGFHWTKQHSPALGEVYVVGIDPSAQGRGLGTVLTLAGLHHLTDLGVAEILLYVESDNAPAVAVYSGLGFTHVRADTHVMYQLG